MLKAGGFIVNTKRKHISVTAPDWERPVRLDSLKGDYTEQAIRERIEGVRVVVPAGGNAPEPAPARFNLLIDIQEKMRQGKGAGYAHWARSFNLHEASKTLIYLRDIGVVCVVG